MKVENLTKFPVKTYENEYRVDIVSQRIPLGLLIFKVKVFVENENKGIFRRKFIIRYTHEIGWNNYDKWTENLIELAETAVATYEENIREAERYLSAASDAITEFKEWDGDLRKEALRND